MIGKKHSLILSACNSLHSLPFSTSQSSTSSNPHRRRSTRQQTCTRDRRKGYATIAGDTRDGSGGPERQEPRHIWPQTPRGQQCLSPYQILDTKENVAYSKAKYYALVKLYHPDLTGNGGHDIPEKVRMERYRLIVAAHTILSDPVKRSAYDRFGAGWNGKAEVRHPDTWSKSSGQHQPGPFSQSWQDASDPIWQNATWEDWERWRMQRDGVYQEKRAPVYMANSWFIAMVVGLAIIGSSLNYNRAQDAGHYFVAQRDLVHDQAAKDLRKTRQMVSGVESREGRIDFFVRQREATLGAGDYESLREEKASRVLKDREVCSSEQIKENGR